MAFGKTMMRNWIPFFSQDSRAWILI